MLQLKTLDPPVRCTDYLDYRDYLRRLYEAAKSAVPTYSYNQLAEDLGFSRTNVLWLVISGRRKLSPRATLRIIEALGLKGAERRYLQALTRYNNARTPEDREALFKSLMAAKTKEIDDIRDQETLDYFSEWYHPVIRELVGLAEFQSDPSWIAGRLSGKVLPRQAQRSLELLERLGLIRFDTERNRHVQLGGTVLSSRSVATMAAVRYHQKMLDIARETLTRVPANVPSPLPAPDSPSPTKQLQEGQKICVLTTSYIKCINQH